MRINHYEFPEGTPTEIMLKEGCAVILKDGSEIFVESIPADKAYLVDYVCPILSALKVSVVKELMKKYGGHGWTEHYDIDGGLFEVTEIKIGQNNSRFKYNHHL